MGVIQSKKSGAESFEAKLAVVNQGVATFTHILLDEIRSESAELQTAVHSYISLLERGGKRTRGMLTVAGYESAAGQDMDMIGAAAGLMEAFHAYLLVIDDYVDSSDLRRGKPTAHVEMTRYLDTRAPQKNNERLGAGAAAMAALYAQHRAQAAVLDLAVPERNKLLATKLISDGLARTNLGQVLDVMATACPDVATGDIETIILYKTAYYSYLLPLQLGAALGGATGEALEMFVDYSLNAGFAFQLWDDIVGLFGDESTTGKSQKGDIVEGKKTLLMADALAHADPIDKATLLQALGTSVTDAQLEACLAIIQKTGAKQRTSALAEAYTQKALAALTVLPHIIPAQTVQFLHDMAMAGIRRNA